MALDKALRYIQANYSQPSLHLGDVAAIACLTEWYFSRLFHRSSGMTFQQYVIALRTEKAKGLLRSSRWSISRVALESGFGTLRNFEAHFKRLAGVTPSEYRRNHTPAGGSSGK